MTAVTMKIEGANELIRSLKRLPINLRKKHLRRAVRQGAALVRNEVRRNAPTDTGRLRRNIKSRSKRGTRSTLRAVVTVNVARRKQGRELTGKFMSTGNRSANVAPNDAYYWRFLERGTSKMNARPFIRPAADAKFREVVNHVIRETQRGVDEDIGKLRSGARGG